MRRVRLHKLSAFLLLFSGALFFGIVCCAQQPAVINVDVRLVPILATVKDPSGSPVGSLEKTSFQVRDNGSLQDIAVFERETAQPLSIAILIDASASTAKDLHYETDSVTRFVRAVTRSGNPGDTVALYSFNWQVIKQTGFTRDAAAVDRQLRQLKGEAGTCLYDAILLASRDMESHTGRKVLIVVTDGGDTGSSTTFQHAVEAAQKVDAVIYPVLVTPVINEAGRNTGGENALTTFSLRTGGQVFRPSLGAALDQAFDGILRDLRTEYLIGFYPKNVPLTADSYHSLSITIADPRGAGWQVTARNGYYGDTAPEGMSASRTGNSSESPDVQPPDETVRKPRPPAPKQTPKKAQLVQNSR